jgi:spermidine synthase
VHGNTTHGGQMLSRDQRRTPISYYCLGGAFADVFGIMPSPRHIAVLGLGAGVLSAYAHTDDTFTYFEIDPDNEKIARTWFTYMDDADARVRVVPGDGRLSMNEAAKGINYDIITIDAFTGDGVPTHLLTREAMEVYLSRLAKDGIILFHISNRYYDLRPVIKSTSQQLKLSGVMNIQVSQTQLPPNGAPSVCVVLARNPENLKPLLARGWVALGEGDGLNECSPWTDDYINILAPLVMRFWPHNSKTSKLMDTVSLPPAGR